jgi:hypothetical protein
MKKEEVKEEIVKKSTIEKENRQLIYFLIIVAIVFACILIPYFWIENSKTFKYSHATWAAEDYNGLKIFHGKFKAFNQENLSYNVFLRNDPRTNNISTEGSFDKFKYGGIVSMSPQVDECRGELSRVMMDLTSFLRQGVGVGPIEAGSTDEFVANTSSRRFATCDTVLDRTVVIIEIGEPSVIQDKTNTYCYTIYAKNCQDGSGVEKFMLETIEKFIVTSTVK